jgi:hypothetical protein
MKNQPTLSGRRVEGFGQAAKSDASHPQVFDRRGMFLLRSLADEVDFGPSSYRYCAALQYQDTALVSD